MAVNSPEDVDSFLEELFVNPDPTLEAALQRSDAAGLAKIAVSPMLGAFLNIIAASLGARRILEIGALGGYSTLWLARALPAAGGVVKTLDIDPKSVATVRATATAAGFADRVEVIEGAAAESLDAMIAKDEPAFDFIFIDADKERYPDYLERAVRLARPGALIVADNVVRDGAVADEKSGNALAAGVREYLKRASRHDRLKTSVIQTVGAKGYDGFSISLVKGD